MLEPPVLPNESQRLAALHRLNILDTPPEERFDRLTRIAARLFDVPVVLVSLVDQNRQWFKSVQGLPERETPRSSSFCAHAIADRKIMTVPDAKLDPRFADNPLVTSEPFIRFYAGQPLAAPDGSLVGTLCIIDRKPRAFGNPQDQQLLADLAHCVENELANLELVRVLEREQQAQIAALEANKQLQLANEQISQSERLFRALIEHSTEMITLINANGTVKYQSPSVSTIMGYNEEDLANRSSFDLVHPDDLSAHLERFQTLFEYPGKVVPSHFRFLHKDGSWRYIEATGQNLLAEPEIEAVVVNGQDVTERKKVEMALHRSEEMLNMALEAAGIGIWEYTVSTGEVRWSDQVEPLLGYAPGTFGGTYETILAMALPEDRERLNQAVEDSIQNHTDYQIEYRVVRPDGGIQWLEGKGRGFYDENGKVLSLNGTVQDITARKETEEALAVSQQQLLQSQKMEAVGRLAGGIAHDFNNILTAILGYAELGIVTMVEGQAGQAELVEIAKEAERAASLTRQLLIFSRKQLIKTQRVDLNQLVRNLNRLLGRLIGEDIRLVFVPGTDLAGVEADPNQLEQVIMNLAVNARDAMPDGGVLTLETAKVEISEEYARRHKEFKPGRFIKFSVKDTGTGMDEATKARMFEPFFTTKPSGKGTGLGLATVYGIVYQSGGFIIVESKLHQGSAFYLYLPIARSTSHLENEVPPSSPKSLLSGPIFEQNKKEEKFTLLVVEDEPSLLEMLRGTLRRQGYRLFEASNVEEALKIYQRHAIDINLLLTDLVLPGGSGVDLAAKLKQFNPALPVLYMSGYFDRPELLDKALHYSGAIIADFIEKPFRAEDLNQKLQNLLTQSFD